MQVEPPIPGMTAIPFGWPDPLMQIAWRDFVLAAVEIEAFHGLFKSETGHDIREVLGAGGITKMIDEATGYKHAVTVAWLDWLTKNHWGEAEQEEVGHAD